MSNIRATLTLHVASYTLSDGRTRPVELAVVRRKRGGRTVRVRVIDAGAATRLSAHQCAIHFAGLDGDVARFEVDHGNLGTFGLDDAGRDGMLAAVRSMDLGLGRVTQDPSGALAWAGNAPLSMQDSAVYNDRAGV